MAKKKVVIVGAGYAGVKAALTLNKKKKRDEMEITLIDKNDFHTLLTELHEVAGNRVSEDAIKIPLSDIFGYTDVKVVKDEIKEFNLDENKLVSDEATYDYDYLILGVGSKPNFFGIPNIEDHAFTLWSYDDAITIREHVKECFRKAAKETNRSELKKLLTFTVVGAGFTGVEMIGELARWTRQLAKEHEIDYHHVSLIIVDMLPRVLNNLKEKNSQKAHEYMEKKLGIEVMLNTKITSADENGFYTQDEYIETKTIIWAAGIKPSDAAQCLTLSKTDRSKRLKVSECCCTDYKNVFAAGDVCGLQDKNGREYPAMVETAHYTGEGAAENILRIVRGKEPEEVEVKSHGMVVCISSKYAVSEAMGMSFPGWISVIMKYMINILYMWEITGFRGVGTYLRHEFLERHQSGLLFGGHLKAKMNTWWLLPLRLFIGVFWLWEGIAKITEGWFTDPKLATFLGMGGADATSSASEAASTVVTQMENVFHFNTGIINFILDKESSVVDTTTVTSSLLAKLEVFHFGSFNLVDWFLQHIVLATDGTAMFFQVLVVLLEIGVGLMFLGGFLNFIASVTSIGLLMMFVTSTGIYKENWWVIFAAIAMIGGAGRTFGFDYYFVPYFSNLWNSWMKNGKLRLFFKGAFNRHER